MAWPGVVTVIGAGSGIGRETAKLFATRGCKKVAIGDVNASGLTKTKEEIQQSSADVEVLDVPCGRATLDRLNTLLQPIDALKVDVTSEDSVNSFVSKVVDKFGRIDYACNVAGILMMGSSADFTAAEFDKQFAVNARGMWLCQKAEIIQMLKQDAVTPTGFQFASRGSIVNIASMAGLRGYDSLPSYVATKHAIVGFTKSDALRYARDHIRINAVCPGVIETPMVGGIDPNDPTMNIAELSKDMAMGRRGRPEEVAEALLWLSSPNASFVTGISLPVNGGMIGA